MSPLVAEIRAGLRARADPQRAPQMQAYMKSDMPYLGVPVPAVRRIAQSAERAHPLTDVAGLIAAARPLWREAAFREERYAATALLGTARARRMPAMALLPLYREMIITGAWWDHVDEISHRVGELLRARPGEMRPVLLDWSGSDDMWLRRSAVISQLDARGATDRELLAAVLAPSIADPRFFLAKAVGWALRQYARTDPEWVRDYVGTHDLRPLSRREALRHIG